MNLFRVFLFITLLAAALMFVSPKTFAQEIPPHTWNDKIERTFDLSSPSEVVVWDDKIALRDSKAVPNWNSRGYWVCHSDSDDSFGACATKGRWRANDYDFKLRFTEAKSGATRTLDVLAKKTRLGLESSLNGPRGGKDPAEVRIDVRISSSELRKLPAGGIWKAHLKLKQMTWGLMESVADTNAEITLHVTDTKNVQIYLPEHSTTTPTVDLGLTGQVSRGGRTAGRRNIDMCLYDGFGSNSSWFDVTVKDDLSVRQRVAGNFSVVRDGTSGQAPRERVDYGVSYLHNGQRQPLNNGETVRLLGGGYAEVRLVFLPNIPVPVMCKPMPLTLETPEFNVKDKDAGSYSGKLRIIFSPSAQSL